MSFEIFKDTRPRYSYKKHDKISAYQHKYYLRVTKLKRQSKLMEQTK